MSNLIVEEYNFESDNESHLNGEDLSELSDFFEDDISEHEKDPSKGSRATSEKSLLTIDDIPYDRDLKFVNVPNAARQKTTGAPGTNRLLKQITEITRGNTKELKNVGGDLYKRSDSKKKDIVEEKNSGKSYQDRRSRSARQKKEKEFPENYSGNTTNNNNNSSNANFGEKRSFQNSPQNPRGPMPQQQHQQQNFNRGYDNEKPKSRHSNKASRNNYYGMDYRVEDPHNSPLPNNYTIEMQQHQHQQQQQPQQYHSNEVHQNNYFQSQETNPNADPANLNPFAQEFVPNFMPR
jgi:hypothetical protein